MFQSASFIKFTHSNHNKYGFVTLYEDIFSCEFCVALKYNIQVALRQVIHNVLALLGVQLEWALHLRQVGVGLAGVGRRSCYRSGTRRGTNGICINRWGSHCIAISRIKRSCQWANLESRPQGSPDRKSVV